jgi:hypothetical protein
MSKYCWSFYHFIQLTTTFVFQSSFSLHTIFFGILLQVVIAKTMLATSSFFCFMIKKKISLKFLELFTCVGNHRSCCSWILWSIDPQMKQICGWTTFLTLVPIFLFIGLGSSSFSNLLGCNLVHQNLFFPSTLPDYQHSNGIFPWCV